MLFYLSFALSTGKLIHHVAVRRQCSVTLDVSAFEEQNVKFIIRVIVMS